MIYLPEYAISVVRQFLGDADRACWAIGDVVNELSAELNEPVAMVARVLAYETGGNDHTYRDYAYVAGRVAPNLRVVYPLTRHQWKACLSAGARYLEVARWALEQADEHGGRPMSIRAIRAHLQGVDERVYDADADYYVERYIARTEALLFTGAYDERAPTWLREMYLGWIAQLRAYVDTRPGQSRSSSSSPSSSSAPASSSST